jgi:hypothetical protein
MIEDIIYNNCVADAVLATTLSTFSGAPAVFSELAPETAARPFIVYRVVPSGVDGAIMSFYVFFDYFDLNTFRTKSRTAAERIQHVFDEMVFHGANLNDVRFKFFAGSPIEAADPRDVHYNLQFSARGTRAKWLTQTR